MKYTTTTYRAQALAAQAMMVEIRRQTYAQLTEQGFKCTSASVERSEWEHPNGTKVLVEEG